MMRIPDKGICYLMPLPKDLSAPDKLIGDLEKASQVRKSFLSMSTLCSSQESVLKLKRDKLQAIHMRIKYYFFPHLLALNTRSAIHAVFNIKTFIGNLVPSRPRRFRM